MAHGFESIILPHITNRSIRACNENLDWVTAKPKELARAFSLLVKLPKLGRDKVFHRRMRDSHFETLPWQHSAGNITDYNREQREKGKALVQMHTDLTLTLKVLFHIALDCFQTPDDGLTTEQLPEECQ